jgi:hypothetical protein
MINKKILCPDRLRQVPAQFSWIDQRLVRENFLRRADPAAWALYLVLVTVADAQGLSYYSEARLGRLLKMDALQLTGCRQQLVAGELLAYEKPLYQVLALPQTTAAALPPADSPRAGQALSLGEVLRRAAQGGAA